MAAILACNGFGISLLEIEKHLKSFSGLEHRIEFVGIFEGIHFYNDSISTIPEATISALKALQNVKTLILGGFDRGIDYSILFEYLEKHPVENIVFTGPAGERMIKEWKNHKISIKNLLFTNQYNEIIEFCRFKTPKNGKCLLSPAAASYDQFKNFEERGNYFKNQIKEQS
jgi:UDP-N-acetylmuramoylalanine--D-glutamate ligase